MKKTGRLALLITGVVLAFPGYVSAANEPGIVSGTLELLEAATSWLFVLIPSGCATMLGWHAFVKQMNEGDPAQAGIHNRAMKNILIGGAIGISAVSIVKAFLAFYS